MADELFETLHEAAGTHVQRIVSWGQASPEGFWYDQEQDEFVLLVSGAARLRFEDETHARSLTAGDYLLIPAHRKHRVDWTDPDQPCVWLAVHMPQAGR
jgi:cupin 2 domain-containing protein